MKQYNIKLRRVLDSWFGAMILVIALFFIQTPYFFSVTPFIKAVAPYVRVILVVFLFLCMLILNGKIREIFRQEKLFWACIAYCIVMIIAMRLEGKTLEYALLDIVPTILISALSLSVFSRVNVKKFLFILFMYFLVINTINNATMLFFYNNGIWLWDVVEPSQQTVFFGHYNASINCGIGSMFFGGIYSRQFSRSWDLVNGINIAYSLLTATVVSCVTAQILYAIVALALILCYLYERWNGLRKVLKWVNLTTIMICNLILFYAVTVKGELWMGKIGIDPSLHGRRELWDTVLYCIKCHPLIGLGYNSWLTVNLKRGVEWTYWHQHSVYLQILYDTGIIGGAIFVFMGVICVLSMRKLKNFGVKFFMDVLVGSYFLAMIADTPDRAMLYLLLASCYYIPKYLPHKE